MLRESMSKFCAFCTWHRVGVHRGDVLTLRQGTGAGSARLVVRGLILRESRVAATILRMRCMATPINHDTTLRVVAPPLPRRAAASIMSCTSMLWLTVVMLAITPAALASQYAVSSVPDLAPTRALKQLPPAQVSSRNKLCHNGGAQQPAQAMSCWPCC